MTVPLSVRFVAEDLDAAVARFNRVAVYRATTATGTYTEVSTPSTRPVLRAGVTTYTFIDQASEPTNYYKFRYARDVLPDVSDFFGGPTQGRKPALDVLSVEELLAFYLAGVKLADGEGKPIPPIVFEHFIEEAVVTLESMLDIAIMPRVIVNELHDFQVRYYNQNLLIQLFVRPILSVEEVRLRLPTALNNTYTVIYPAEGYKPHVSSGQLNIIPGGGVTLVGNVTLQQMLLGASRFLPNVFETDYTAGWSTVPADLRGAVGRLAAMGYLPLANNFVYPPGLVAQRTAVDGLMTEQRTAQGTLGGAYGGMIREYKNRLDDEIPKLRQRYHGIKVGVLG